jgi:hypothetical protein
MSSNFNTGDSITEYGVRTPNSSTILIVTTDGRVVHRTIAYGAWQVGDDEGELAIAG